MLPLVLLLSLSLLTACTTTPSYLIPIDVENVTQAQSWEMKGKLAVRTPDDNLSSNIYWLHTEEKDELRLTTPIGTTVLTLVSQQGETLLDVDGKRYQHHDAQQLLNEVTGWSIPVDALPLWITGQVSPVDELLTSDEQQRPKRLVTPKYSPTWQVEFKSWQQQSGATIPRLLQLQRGELRLKLQINQWQALTTDNNKKSDNIPKVD